MCSHTRNIDAHAAVSAARMCNIQLPSDSHFSADNPAKSELFSLLCFEDILNIGKIVRINAFQCTLGLRIYDQLIYTNTIMLVCNVLIFDLFSGGSYANVLVTTI